MEDWMLHVVILRAFSGSWLMRAVAVFLVASCALSVQTADASDAPICARHCFSLNFKGERFVSSHTSYQFDNPFPPNQSPLSRLEFPMDAWWGGIELHFQKGRFSAGAEALTNTLGDVDGVMKDSDWDDEENPERLTIYSESRNRMKRSFRIEFDSAIEIADWLGLPRRLSLRPLVGFRYQDYHFVAHDGMQTYPDTTEDPIVLEGDSIIFRQRYWHYFAGFRAQSNIPHISIIPAMTVLFQLDRALVNGSNKDHHLMREGERYTYEITSGSAWHGCISLKKGISRRFSFDIHAEYSTIQTAGEHRIVNKLFDMDERFPHIAKAWSKQTSIGFTVSGAF
jgi:outer membrane protease